MMFLDPDIIVKRTAIGVASLVVAAGFGLTYYFGLDFNSEINQTKSAAETLKEETTKLTDETTSIKTTISSNTKDLKSSILSNVEETKKLDTDLKSQNLTLKQLVQDYEKYKIEVKTDFAKLKTVNEALLDQLQAREKYHAEQLKLRDTIIEKNKADLKAEILNLQDQLKIREKEISELKIKIDKEVEWRNRNFFAR